MILNNDVSYELGILVYNMIFFSKVRVSDEVSLVVKTEDSFFNVTAYDICDNVTGIVQGIGVEKLNMEHFRSGFFAEHFNKMDVVKVDVSVDILWDVVSEVLEL